MTFHQRKHNAETRSFGCDPCEATFAASGFNREVDSCKLYLLQKIKPNKKHCTVSTSTGCQACREHKQMLICFIFKHFMFYVPFSPFFVVLAVCWGK